MTPLILLCFLWPMLCWGTEHKDSIDDFIKDVMPIVLNPPLDTVDVASILTNHTPRTLEERITDLDTVIHLLENHKLTARGVDCWDTCRLIVTLGTERKRLKNSC